MELQSRDYLILHLVFRFRFCLGRHVRLLAGFNGVRSTDRRLRALVAGNYLSRKKYLYGTPYLYSLTYKGRMLLGVNKRPDKIRLDKITHDIYVLEAVIYFVKRKNVALDKIITEKELHIKDGFGMRTHHPDFTFDIAGMRAAVEIELHAKTKPILEKNMRANYLNFDCQFWITHDSKTFALIQNLSSEYTNIDIIRLEEILNYVGERYG